MDRRSYTELGESGSPKTVLVVSPVDAGSVATLFNAQKRESTKPSVQAESRVKAPDSKTKPEPRVESERGTRPTSGSRASQYRRAKVETTVENALQAVAKADRRVLISVKDIDHRKLGTSWQSWLRTVRGTPIVWLPHDNAQQTVVRKDFAGPLIELLGKSRTPFSIFQDTQGTDSPVWFAFSAAPPPPSAYPLKPWSKPEVDPLPPTNPASFENALNVREWTGKHPGITHPPDSYPWPLGSWKMDPTTGLWGRAISQLRQLPPTALTVPQEPTISLQGLEETRRSLQMGAALDPIDGTVRYDDQQARIMLNGSDAYLAEFAAKEAGQDLLIWIWDLVRVPVTNGTSYTPLTLELVNPGTHSLPLDRERLERSLRTRLFWATGEQQDATDERGSVAVGQNVKIPFQSRGVVQGRVLRLSGNRQKALVLVQESWTPRGGIKVVTDLSDIELVGAQPAGEPKRVADTPLQPSQERPNPSQPTAPKNLDGAQQPTQTQQQSTNDVVWSGLVTRGIAEIFQVIAATGESSERLTLRWAPTTSPELYLIDPSTGNEREIKTVFDGAIWGIPIVALGTVNLIKVLYRPTTQTTGSVESWGVLSIADREARLVLASSQLAALKAAGTASAALIGQGSLQAAIEAEIRRTNQDTPPEFAPYFSAFRQSLQHRFAEALGPKSNPAIEDARREGFVTFDRLLRSGDETEARKSYFSTLLAHYKRHSSTAVESAYYSGALEALAAWRDEPRSRVDPGSRLLPSTERATKPSASATERARKFQEAAKKRREQAVPFLNRPPVARPTAKRVRENRAQIAKGQNLMLLASIYEALAKLLLLGCEPPYVGSVDPCLPDYLSALDTTALVEQIFEHESYQRPQLSRKELNELQTFLISKPANRHLARVQRLLEGCSDDFCSVPLSGRDLDELGDALLFAAKEDGKFRALQEALRNINRLYRAGITQERQYLDTRAQLMKLGKPEATPKQIIIDRIMEYAAKGTTLGYVPTPPSLAKRMVQEAMLGPSSRVLDGQAGTAALASAIRAAGVEPDVAELDDRLRELLELQGYNLVGRDFLTLQGQWDAIIGNPPFQAGQDQKHIQHAWSLLKPGGRLVYLLSEASTNDKRFPDFNKWLKDNGARIEKLPAGTFRGGQPSVGVGANLIVMQKAAAQVMPAPPSTSISLATPGEQQEAAADQPIKKRGDWLTDPRCSICKRPRGSNDQCEKCLSTRRMLQERDNPTPEQQAARTKEMADFEADLSARQHLVEARIARYAGRKILVALVGCGRAKLPRKAKAKDLYTGSLFRAARAYAEKCADEWLIISALHGVISPEEEIAPYDKTLDEMGERELAHWQERNAKWIVQHYKGIDVEFIGLAARNYLGGLGKLSLDEPMDGLGIGERLRWLKEATANCAPRPGLATQEGDDRLPGDDAALIEFGRLVRAEEPFLATVSGTRTRIFSLSPERRTVWKLSELKNSEMAAVSVIVPEDPAAAVRGLLVRLAELTSADRSARLTSVVIATDEALEQASASLPNEDLYSLSKARQWVLSNLGESPDDARMNEVERSLLKLEQEAGADRVRLFWGEALRILRELRPNRAPIELTQTETKLRVGQRVKVLEARKDATRGRPFANRKGSVFRFSSLNGDPYVRFDLVPRELVRKTELIERRWLVPLDEPDDRELLQELEEKKKDQQARSEQWERHRGDKYDSNLGAVEIAKRLRAEVREWVKLNPKYEGIAVSITTDKSTVHESISIEVRDFPGDAYTDEAISEYEDNQRRMVDGLTPDAREALAAFEAMANAYQKSEVHSQSDYANQHFYLTVKLADYILRNEAARRSKKLTQPAAASPTPTSAPPGLVPAEPSQDNDSSLERLLSRATPLASFARTVFLQLVRGLRAGQARKIARSKGFMPVSVDKLTTQLYAIAHRYEQNGDLVDDPDVQFFVVGDFAERVYPVAITQGALGSHRDVIQRDADGRPVSIDLRESRDLAAFCNTWMRNIYEQQGLRDNPIGEREGMDDRGTPAPPTEQQVREKREREATTLVGRIEAWIEDGRFIRGNDYLDSLAADSPAEAIQEALSWARNHPSREVERHVGDKLASLLRRRPKRVEGPSRNLGIAGLNDGFVRRLALAAVLRGVLNEQDSD